MSDKSRAEKIKKAGSFIHGLILHTAKVLFINYTPSRAGWIITIRHNLLSIQKNIKNDKSLIKVLETEASFQAGRLSIKSELDKEFNNPWEAIQPPSNLTLSLAIKSLLGLSSVDYKSIITVLNNSLPESYIILEKEII